MALLVNGARGEVALTIGDTELVIAAEMQALAAMSTQLNCKSLAELFSRLSKVEIAATIAAIQLMTVRGDAGAALKQLKLSHFEACATAFAAALAHHFEGQPGNAAAAGTTD